MSLKELTDALGAVAGRQPAVGTVVEQDIERLNGLPAVKYGAFIWTQDRHQVDLLSGLATFNFYLFYVDRVDTADRTEVDAQSTGIDVLTNVIRSVADRYDLDVLGTLDFQPFYEDRFKDDCAGVYVRVSFQTDAFVGCEDDFDD